MKDKVVYTEDKFPFYTQSKPHSLAAIHVGSHGSGSIGDSKVKTGNHHCKVWHLGSDSRKINPAY